MFIETIQFEIRDRETGNVEEFMIEATEENLYKVNSHRYTRCIQFLKEFDFDFAKNRKYPVEMLSFSTELENELCEIDEMVGVFA